MLRGHVVKLTINSEKYPLYCIPRLKRIFIFTK